MTFLTVYNYVDVRLSKDIAQQLHTFLPVHLVQTTTNLGDYSCGNPINTCMRLHCFKCERRGGKSCLSEDLSFVTRLWMYCVFEWSRNGKTCLLDSLVFLQVGRTPRIRFERKSAYALLILASAAIQCAMEFGCWMIEVSVPYSICRNSSLD